MIAAIVFSVILAPLLACETDLDCSLGGKCISDTKTCKCSKEWKGEDCGVVALLPAEMDNGFRPPSSSCWGGKIILDTSGEYHLYAALMAGKCGLSTWNTNSEIVHAVSNEKPTGPYHSIPSELPVVDPFSHNPTVERVSTEPGESLYVMAHIGCGGETVTPQECNNGTTPTSIYHDLQGGCDSPHWAGMDTSSTPEGPWTSTTPDDKSLFITNPDPNEPTWHKSWFTNPSIWAFDNGAILLAYSVNCDECEVSPGQKHIGIAYAETWLGPYIDLTPKEPIFPFASEDPCIFISPERGTYHLLAHATGEWHSVSAHAFSKEPRGPWAVSDTIPYDKTILWASGETTTVQKRERPQIIFLNGVPSLLVNGVEPGRNPSPFTPDGYTGDWTYTHVQAINT